MLSYFACYHKDFVLNLLDKIALCCYNSADPGKFLGINALLSGKGVSLSEK
jgi:hypothetical protein